MNWTITAKPNDPALTSWSWTAVRDDQESVLSGGTYPTSAAAFLAAEAEAQEFEDGQGIIRDNTVQQVFEPVIP